MKYVALLCEKANQSTNVAIKASLQGKAVERRSGICTYTPVPLHFTLIQRQWGSCIMQEIDHPAKVMTVILDEIQPGRNWFSHSLLSLSKKVKIVKMINHFQCILYIFTMTLSSMSYVQCILVKVYLFI